MHHHISLVRFIGFFVSALFLLAACNRADETKPVADSRPSAEQQETQPPLDKTLNAPDLTAPHQEAKSNHEAHVHGEAELSVVREGSNFTVELFSPMANFGAAEHQQEAYALSNAVSEGLSAPGTEAINAFASQFIWPGAAGCKLTSGTEAYGFEGEHSHATLTAIFGCAAPDAAEAVEVKLVDLSGFDEIEAIALIGESQIAATLDAKQSTLKLR